MSCPEVMYQAYYPYLYQRASTSAPSPANVHRAAHFSPFSHQYDRFNVQRSLDQPSTSSLSSETYHVPHHSHTPSHHSSAGSVSSNGGIGSPGSPTTVPIRYKEEDTSNSKDGERRETAVDDEEEDDAGSTNSNSRAQYVSANCVVFTHYSGDVAAVVDEHFTRALNYATELKNNVANTKEYSPMTARNFPPSFWNSNYQAVSVSTAHPSDFYSGESAYHAAVAAAASNSAGADPWHSHYQQYAAHHHHRAVHEYHHHNMAAQYSSLLIPPTSRLPAHMAAATHQYHHSKTGVEHWSSSHTAASHHRLHHDQSTNHHALDATSSPYPTYSSMTGLEAQVQESSKDLYWF